MLGAQMLNTSGGVMGGDLSVLAARQSGGGVDEVLALISHYRTYAKGTPAQSNDQPPTLDCFALTVQLRGVPWEAWTWTQYSNLGAGALTANAWGSGTGASAELSLRMHGNSFTSIHLAPQDAATSTPAPEGESNVGYPPGVVYSASLASTIESNKCGPSPPRAANPPGGGDGPEGSGKDVPLIAGLAVGGTAVLLALGSWCYWTSNSKTKKGRAYGGDPAADGNHKL